MEEQLYHANQVIKHIDQINGLLGNYLQEAREWQKQYQNTVIGRNFMIKYMISLIRTNIIKIIIRKEIF